LELPPVPCLVLSWAEPYSGKPRRFWIAKRKLSAVGARLRWRRALPRRRV